MREAYELATTEARFERARPLEVPAPPPAHAAPQPQASYPYGRMYDPEEGGEDSGYARIREYWRSVRKHFWMVLGVMIIITVLVAVYMARQPDLFEAQARVQVDLELNNPALGALKGTSVILNAPSQDPTYLNTQIQILTSSGLLGRVVKTLDLEHNQAFLNPQSVQHRSTWDSLKRMVGMAVADKGPEREQAKAPPDAGRVLSTKTTAPVTAQEDLAEVNRLAPFVRRLQGSLSVKQLNDTRLIQISLKHYDAEVATKVVNAIADTFVLSNLERKTETSSTAGDFLQKRVAELQSDIRNGEERLLNYAKSHQILSLDDNQNTVVERLAGLNKQLLEAENERKLAESAYIAAQEPGAAEALAEEAGKQTADGAAKLAELKQRRAQLLVEYTEKYPEVKEIDQQIAALETHGTEAKGRAVAVVTRNLETRYRQSLDREKSLRAAFNEQRSETLHQNEAAVNYRILQQEIETNKTLLDGLLQRSKENDIVVAGTPNNIHIVDYAPRPTSPVGPRRLQAVAVAALLSLVFGVALARYLDYLDDSIHTVEDVEKFARLPTLAMIPASGGLARRRLLPAVTALQRRNAVQTSELLIGADGRSPLAEAYRHLRTSVLLSSAGGAPQVLLVTSSQPAEGKTTTAINTALTLSQTGARVIIIDADMRRPRVHSVFDLMNFKGLSTVLASKLSAAEMMTLVQEHDETGLYVLTAGSPPPNPAELLGSEQMRRLVVLLQTQFDHIVIDSPPVASFTDGVLLSSMCDGVLLVVHAGRASRALVRRTRQLLQDVGARIFGVVLNHVDLRQQDDYYYSQYYYSESYYGAEAEADSSAA